MLLAETNSLSVLLRMHIIKQKKKKRISSYHAVDWPRMYHVDEADVSQPPLPLVLGLKACTTTSG